MLVSATTPPNPFQDKFCLSENIVKVTRKTCAIQIKSVPLHTINYRLLPSNSLSYYYLLEQ